MYGDSKVLSVLSRRSAGKNFRYTVNRATGYWEFWDQIIIWLENEIGPMNQNWTYEWDHNKYYFKFKTEEDKVRFILRWV